MKRQIKKHTLFITALLVSAFTALFLLHPPAAAQEGDAVIIPAIGVHAPIIPIFIRDMGNGEVTWDTTTLNMTVGHLTGLPWFGQGGNVVLGGHSELGRRQPDIFYNLDKMEVGQEIIVRTGGQELRYQVTETRRVTARDLSILSPSDGERLTLFTCDLATASGGRYPNRFVVIAVRAGG